MNNWQLLKHLFEEDDGSLPDIYVEPVTDSELIEIYKLVRSVSEIPREANAWSIKDQRDVLLIEVDDPAKRLVAGELELFRHQLGNLQIGGIKIPQLSVEISKNCVSFDYRMGAEWGPDQLSALFIFLKHIREIASKARIFQAWEGSYESPNAIFEEQFQKFLSTDT